MTTNPSAPLVVKALEKVPRLMFRVATILGHQRLAGPWAVNDEGDIWIRISPHGRVVGKIIPFRTTTHPDTHYRWDAAPTTEGDNKAIVRHMPTFTMSGNAISLKVAKGEVDFWLGKNGWTLTPEEGP